MTVTRRWLPVVLALCAVWAGCSRPSLVGTWRGAQTREGLTGTANLTLREDRTYELTVDIGNGSGDERLRQASRGTYTVQGRELTLRTTRITLEGMPLPVQQDGTLSELPYRLRGDRLILDLGGEDRLDLKRVNR